MKKMTQTLEIGGQEITLETSLEDDATEAIYSFSSELPLRPMRIAVAMLRIAESICLDNNVDILDFIATSETEDDSNVH